MFAAPSWHHRCWMVAWRPVLDFLYCFLKWLVCWDEVSSPVPWLAASISCFLPCCLCWDLCLQTEKKHSVINGQALVGLLLSFPPSISLLFLSVRHISLEPNCGRKGARGLCGVCFCSCGRGEWCHHPGDSSISCLWSIPVITAPTLYAPALYALLLLFAHVCVCLGGTLRGVCVCVCV